MRLSLLCNFLLLLSSAGYGQLKITSPLKGIEGKDYFINYYIDHDKKKDGIKDPFCGTKTYDGHTGTDFMIKSFAAMDSGVYIYAVADGKVYEVKDGNFDRNKTLNKSAKANYVAIGSADNYYIYYYHMMKNSIMVKVGDIVHCGQPIGKVGASGYACDPHVHLEIRNKFNYIIDPFTSDCHIDTSVRFISPPAYDTMLSTIDNGFVPYIPGYDTLRERYLVTDSFSIKKHKTVCFWAQMNNLRAGDEIKYIWVTPRDRVWHVQTDRWTNNSWFGYSWSWIDMPERKGKWTLKYCVNNKIISTRHFYVL